MDLITSMSIFVRTVELGSFRKAAEVSGISATMVAKHIAALEERLSGRLLVKTTRRQWLTALGEAHYERCRRILDEVERADLLAANMLVAPVGTLRVSAPPAFGIHVLTPLISRFLQRYENISVDLSLVDRKVDFVEEGFELGFRIGAVEDDSLIARPLPTYELMLAASRDYLKKVGTPEAPADLVKHELIGFRQWNADRMWRLQGNGEVVEIPLKSRFLVNNAEAAKQAALSGLGIVLQSTITLSEPIASGSLVRVLPDFVAPSQSVHLVYLPDRHRSAKLNAFISFVLSALGTGSPSIVDPGEDKQPLER
jgi:DNA-binding transcriptional LysR family regulator